MFIRSDFFLCLEVALVGALVTAGAACLSYSTIPLQPSQPTDRFDVLLVLGAPALFDGSASPEQRVRVEEAVREYKLGRAPRLLLCGGAAHNRFVESDAMAALAEQEGVPAAAVFRERQSRNTVENLANGAEIMRHNGWRSAEIVSSPSHLPRAALIMKQYPLRWATHAALWPERYPEGTIVHQYIREIGGTALIRWFGLSVSPWLSSLSERMATRKRGTA